MSYSAFTLRKAKEELNLNFIEGVRFLPNLDVITPSNNLIEFLQESIPLAIAMGSEKARSELIIYSQTHSHITLSGMVQDLS